MDSDALAPLLYVPLSQTLREHAPLTECHYKVLTSELERSNVTST
jgi:hypothetical protein